MKEGWEYKTLGECCEILDRLRKPIKQSKRESGNIPYYGATGLLDYVNDYIFDDTLVLLGEDGAKWGAGDDSAFIISGKTWVNNHAHVLKPYTFLNERYLVYYLKMSNLSDYVTGVTVPKLNQEKMRQIIIPLTTLNEQCQIVSYLDSSFKLIDEIKNKALKSLTEAKALFQSALAEAMEPKEGWEEKTFGEMCTYHKEQKRENGYKYIGMENIESGTGNLIGYGSTDNVLSSTFFFKKGEVLYGRLRPYLKKVYIAEFDGCCSTEIFPIKTNGVLPGLIKYWFLTDEITNKINDTSAGCRMPRGNMNEVLQFHLNIPSDKQSQMQIVSHLDSLSSKVRAIEEKYQKMVEECDALKQAMLRDVFE